MVLLEKDLRKILIKNGLPQEAADWAHHLNSKYAGFIANAAFFKNNEYVQNPKHFIESKAYLRLESPIRRIIELLFKEQEKPILPVSPNSMSYADAENYLSQLNYMRDWFNNPTREDTVDPKKLSWSDALEKTRKYHEDQERKAGSKALTMKEGQKIVLTFPDGFYWLQLNASSCREEADAMGHCGTAQNGELFSLRDRTGYPFITAEIDVSAHSSEQIYGRANTKPKEKYHKKILELLGKLHIERVGTKSYNEESLHVEDDISSELKDWFEDKFGYYPTTGGVTEKELREFSEYIRSFNSQHSSLSIHTMDVDSEIRVEYIISIPLAQYASPDSIEDIDEIDFDLGDITSYAPGSDIVSSIYKDTLYIRGTLGDYNTDDRYGWTHNHRGSTNDSPKEWFENAIESQVTYYEDDMTDYLGEMFRILYEEKIITKFPPIIRLTDYLKESKSSRFSFYNNAVQTSVYLGDDTLSEVDADFIKNLNDLSIVDTFYFRRGGESRTQMKFSDFLPDNNNSSEELSNLFNIQRHSSGSTIIIRSEQLTTTDVTSQENIAKAVVLFDRTWPLFTKYINSFFGKDGSEIQQQAFQYAERMKKVYSDADNR